MPFRGHNIESAKHLSDQNDYRFSDENHGVFLEILKFSAYLDPVLSRHVQTIAMKASASQHKLGDGTKRGRGSIVTFCSKTTINKLVSMLTNKIQYIIDDEVRQAGSFSIQIDTTQDIGCIDQCAIVPRYVLDGEVHERLLALVPIS